MLSTHDADARPAFHFLATRGEDARVSDRRADRREGRVMGQPVVHFEVVGKDAGKLQSNYSELFGWEIDADNPLGYGIVAREGNTNEDGAGIGGGVATGPSPDYPGHVTFYVEVPDVEAALARAEDLGGTRVFGPAAVPGTEVELGQFTDPEGHLIGLTKAA
jgi:predicted enzyme related to lactoylglutathione lyase